MSQQSKDGKKHIAKKVYIIIGIVLIFILLLIAAVVWYLRSHQPDVTLKTDTITLEYGDKVSINPKELLQTDDQEVYDTAKINTTPFVYKKDRAYPEVGAYKLDLEFTQKQKQYTKEITVTIQDTKAPELIPIKDKKLEFTASKEKPNYRQYFKVRDLSKSNLSVDDAKVTYTKAGKYTVLIIAEDAHKNKTSKTVQIIIRKPAEKPKSTQSPSPQPTQQSVPKNTQSPAQRSGGLTYVQGILVVNKKHCLPTGYAPGENPTAGSQMRTMIADMQKAGLNISNSYSGYRSYEYQANLYQSYVATHGQAKADTFSARPGCSEHQSGLAFDFLYGDGQLVSGGAEASWITNNAHKYGFIVRYQPGKESITGYQSEPWHVRYIGAQATAIRNSGLTLEEYLGVPGGGY